MEILAREVMTETPDFVRGQIKYIEHGAEYGLIESNAGRLLFFHRSSVSGVAFTSLNAGDRVCYMEEYNQGEPLQASMVFLDEE